jgi:hypothetical protein
MLELADLISALHVSVQQAGEALSEANYRAFERYFVDTKDAADAKTTLKNALAEAAALSKTEAPEEVMRRLLDSLQAATSALNSGSTALQPKMVAIDFPTVTKDGPTVHTVHVPLITLAPFAGVQISKLTFRGDLDVQEGTDGKLRVAFAPTGQTAPAPSAANGTNGVDNPAPRRSNTSIEIVVENAPIPDGFRKVIEGYERALRAQIPG